MTCLKWSFQATLFLALGTLSSGAGTFSTDFNTGGLPPGTHTNANAAGGAYLELTGGVGNSGCLKLTKNINSQQASFILDDLDAGQPIYGFDITFKMRLGGGTSPPADGMSLCVAPDITDTSNFGETGAGSGLRFCWPFYTGSGQTPPDPAIKVRAGPAGGVVAWKGYTVAGITTTGDFTTWWADVHIRLNADSSLVLDYKGENVFTNFFIPGYQEFVNAGLPVRFGLGARTGGLNANQWIDNLQITTFTQPMVGISQQPFSQTIQQGDTAQFDVGVGNTNGVTYQWLSNNVPIAGANSPTLVLTNVQPSASGSLIKVTVTGPNNAVTSSVATLTVINLALPAPPQIAFNFEGGTVPAEASLTGTALLDTVGGVANSGCVKLVNPSGSGALIVTNPAEAGQPVYAFTARFQALVGGGTIPPADGFAFAFGTDIPDTPGGEFENGAGLGTGLRVTFDIFNNDGIFGYNPSEAQPAPSIDVRFGSLVLGTVRMPISFMESGFNPEDGNPAYTDTIIQLNPDGTLNVVYHGALVFDRLPIPGFSFVVGGRFAVAARTGGLNENIWVDDFQLTSVTNSGGNFRITTQPVSQTVLVNHAATFTVGVNDTNGVTYQWQRYGTNLPGATGSSYTVSPALLADSGAPFAVTVTRGVTLTSTVANLTVVDLMPPSSPNYSFDFNNGLVPVGTAVYGNAYVTAAGGVGDSGVLHLTDAINDQNSAFVIPAPFSGAQVSSISAAFDLRLGGGSGIPADGFSFNWAPGLPSGTTGNAENGAFNTTGLSIAFRIYLGAGNADNPPSPYIGVRYKGTMIASTQVPYAQLDTGTDYRKVLLRVDPTGKVYLAYGERVLYNGLQLPNYTFLANARFGIYGRTGGENNNQWFDNILIQATQSSGPLTVTEQPANASVLAGNTATFSVGLSDPNGASYQWQKQSLGGAFTNIPSATAASYTTPPTTQADNGARFRVNASGPSGNATSSSATLTVVAPITISNPSVNYDFNDGLLPEGTILNGGGYIAGDGGVTNSGVLRLTDAVNGQGGTFIIPDLNTNTPVQAVTLYFAARIGGGTVPPADGFSVSWCSSNDFSPTIVAGEDGVGNNLIVSFDIFDNGNETPPAPSIDVLYKGSLVGTKQMPFAQLETGDNFTDVFIRLNASGTLDLQYKGMVIFNGLALPGYTALAGGVFVFGARTGGLNEYQWVDNIAVATTPGLIPIAIGYARVGNDLRLTWGEGFKLQSTKSLSPVNWLDVPGATSPYTTLMTEATLFYRLAPSP